MMFCNLSLNNTPSDTGTKNKTSIVTYITWSISSLIFKVFQWSSACMSGLRTEMVLMARWFSPIWAVHNLRWLIWDVMDRNKYVFRWAVMEAELHCYKLPVVWPLGINTCHKNWCIWKHKRSHPCHVYLSYTWWKKEKKIF